MKLSDGTVRFIKGAGAVMLAAFISYVENTTNLTGILNPTIATIVAGLALVIEGAIKDAGHGALFGMASKPTTYQD